MAREGYVFYHSIHGQMHIDIRGIIYIEPRANTRAKVNVMFSGQ